MLRNSISILILICFVHIHVLAQSYTSYFTGNVEDRVTSPLGGICLMGGASENDEAMKWFLKRASGGDILVLRASGSDGYNNYLFSELGMEVNSVETIVFHEAAANNETYIHDRIEQAEAIWFAGGDQWKYVSYWRDTKIDSLINIAITNRNIVIGGTSAGMAILGGHYFSAEKGTITSPLALADPYNEFVTVDSTAFINLDYLQDVVTDTHYDNPIRKGRHVVFMARMIEDYGVDAKGIACEEHTAVCINTEGIASVFGDPDHDDIAYFIQVNCRLENPSPEVIKSSTPLDWNKNGSALKVYAVKGTANGSSYFNLNDWLSGKGGTWHDWYVDKGIFHEEDGTFPTCGPLGTHQNQTHIQVFPNPVDDVLNIAFGKSTATFHSVQIVDLTGKIVAHQQGKFDKKIDIKVRHLPTGIYHLLLTDEKNNVIQISFLKN
ncbi:T9SS type A sorting domain-containing protein [Ekhidna sp.]|uniref:T9SS type A sorting domain-containing protein n=1 Tax=Ekhidna sp. TaxID=2608089 RepID=UPI003CCBAB5C